VLLSVTLDGRNATTSFDGPADNDSLGRVVDGVLEAARVRPVDPDWPGLAARSPAPVVDHYDEATANATPDDRANLVHGFVSAAGGLECAGFCSTAVEHVAFANSLDQRLTGRATVAELDGICRTPTADGSARHASVGVAALNGSEIGSRAAMKARSASDGTDLQPGRYEVVLEPACVADMLAFLVTFGFSGRAVEEGRSFAALGSAQFDPSISLRDDITDPLMIGVPFDVEGTPKVARDLVRDGTTVGLLHTRRSARKMHTESTGHAVEGGAAWGVLGGNLVLEVERMAEGDLVAGVERGVLVTDFHYTRILDPRTQVVTGLTRNGVWLIEDGRIVRPITNMRFTQSYLEALAPGMLVAASRERALARQGWEEAYLVPSLHLASWNFTGGARG
jgi:predicted Zn-dependent protease